MPPPRVASRSICNRLRCERFGNPDGHGRRPTGVGCFRAAGWRPSGRFRCRLHRAQWIGPRRATSRHFYWRGIGSRRNLICGRRHAVYFGYRKRGYRESGNDISRRRAQLHPQRLCFECGKHHVHSLDIPDDQRRRGSSSGEWHGRSDLCAGPVVEPDQCAIAIQPRRLRNRDRRRSNRFSRQHELYHRIGAGRCRRIQDSHTGISQ